MQGFVNETGTTVGVDKSTVTYQASFYKLGASAGWSSSQLPINLTKAKYRVELELVDSASGQVFIGFAQSGTNLAANYVGSAQNSWGYYCNTGNKYIAGANTAFGPGARTGDKIIMKFSFDSPTVRVYKNKALIGFISDIPFQNNNLRIFVTVNNLGEHVIARVTIKQ